MARQIRIKARRGRPPIMRGASERFSVRKRNLEGPKGTQNLTEEKGGAQQSYCLIKRLYQGGFISFDAMQAAYKFGRLHRHYLFVLGAPQCVQARSYPDNLPRIMVQDSSFCQDERLEEWRQTLKVLRNFGTQGEFLLKKALKEADVFLTCNEILTLNDVLSAKTSLYSEFQAMVEKSSCSLGNPAV